MLKCNLGSYTASFNVVMTTLYNYRVIITRFKNNLSFKVELPSVWKSALRQAEVKESELGLRNHGKTFVPLASNLDNIDKGFGGTHYRFHTVH